MGNLRALTMANGDMGPPPRPAVQGYRDPLREIDLNSVTSGSDAKTACTLPQQREKEQLDAHHIYSYRGRFLTQA